MALFYPLVWRSFTYSRVKLLTELLNTLLYASLDFCFCSQVIFSALSFHRHVSLNVISLIFLPRTWKPLKKLGSLFAFFVLFWVFFFPETLPEFGTHSGLHLLANTSNVCEPHSLQARTSGNFFWRPSESVRSLSALHDGKWSVRPTPEAHPLEM